MEIQVSLRLDQRDSHSLKQIRINSYERLKWLVDGPQYHYKCSQDTSNNRKRSKKATTTPKETSLRSTISETRWPCKGHLNFSFDLERNKLSIEFKHSYQHASYVKKEVSEADKENILWMVRGGMDKPSGVHNFYRTTLGDEFTPTQSQVRLFSLVSLLFKLTSFHLQVRKIISKSREYAIDTSLSPPTYSKPEYERSLHACKAHERLEMEVLEVSSCWDAVELRVIGPEIPEVAENAVELIVDGTREIIPCSDTNSNNKLNFNFCRWNDEISMGIGSFTCRARWTCYPNSIPRSSTVSSSRDNTEENCCRCKISNRRPSPILCERQTIYTTSSFRSS